MNQEIKKLYNETQEEFDKFLNTTDQLHFWVSFGVKVYNKYLAMDIQAAINHQALLNLKPIEEFKKTKQYKNWEKKQKV